jgi:ubiquinone biosynthesis monooxygenase Coq7
MSAAIIRRILRVNHAGEHGAVAIYTSQLARARQAHWDLTPWLEETLAHEERHRARFLAAMPARGAKPCRAMFVWGAGGALLGALTAFASREAILVCTAAVECTVHKHLIEQADFLDRADPELAALVRDILTEEDAHLAFAEERHDPHKLDALALGAIVSAATEVLIFLSTRGDSLKLKRAMVAA